MVLEHILYCIFSKRFPSLSKSQNRSVNMICQIMLPEKSIQPIETRLSRVGRSFTEHVPNFKSIPGMLKNSYCHTSKLYILENMMLKNMFNKNCTEQEKNEDKIVALNSNTDVQAEKDKKHEKKESLRYSNFTCERKCEEDSK